MSTSRQTTSAVRITPDAHDGLRRLIFTYALTIGKQVSMSQMVTALVTLGKDHPDALESVLRASVTAATE